MDLITAFTHLEGKSILLLGLGGLGKTYLEILNKFLYIKHPVYVIDSHLDQNYIKNSHFQLNVQFIEMELTKNNYQRIISSYLSAGDILLNLTNHCDSQDLIEFCLKAEILYQDTAWVQWKSDRHLTLSMSDQDGQIFNCKRTHQSTTKGFALTNFGINPGLISIIARKLIDHYKFTFGNLPSATKIYFTEYDAHENDLDAEVLVSTWSPYELWKEFSSPAEFYFRTSTILAEQEAAKIKLKAWSKTVGNYTGYLVPHREVISFVKSLSAQDQSKILFSGFCYHPPKGSVEKINNLNGEKLSPSTLNSKIKNGDRGEKNFDEIGVLIGDDQNWMWSGYTFYLNNSVAHSVSTNSTLYLVAASAVCGLLVALIGENTGVLEAEDIEHSMLLKISKTLIGHPHTLILQKPDDLLTSQIFELTKY